jgi:hypothetical protein
MPGMGDSERAAARAQAEQTLRQFLKRADSVAECEMLKHEDFESFGHVFTLTPVPGTTHDFEVSVRMAPKHEVEQAIARLRPVVLNDDPIFWAKVLKAISARAVDRDQIKDEITRWKKAWNAFPPKYMTYMVANTQTGESYEGDDADIAIDWIYSELLHAKTEAAERIRLVQDEVKWQTANNFARDGINITLNLARAIRTWAEDGLIDLAEQPA